MSATVNPEIGLTRISCASLWVLKVNTEGLEIRCWASTILIGTNALAKKSNCFVWKFQDFSHRTRLRSTKIIHGASNQVIIIIVIPIHVRTASEWHGHRMAEHIALSRSPILVMSFSSRDIWWTLWCPLVMLFLIDQCDSHISLLEFDASYSSILVVDPYFPIMRACLTYLVSIIAVACTEESVSLGYDFDILDPSEDSLLPSEETSGWSEGDGGEAGLDILNNPTIISINCLSDTDLLDMTASEQLLRRELCPNNLFRTPSSSQDRGSALNRKFLETLPNFNGFETQYKYKEPNPDLCPDYSLKGYIYPVCGRIEETIANGVQIPKCKPCTLL